MREFDEEASGALEGESGREQDRTFRFLRLEEAYTQEAGEWQFRLTTAYSKGTFTEREPEGFGESEVTRRTVKSLFTALELEYGLTDRLEANLAVPITLWEHRRGSNREFEFGVPEASSRFGFDEEDFGDVFLGLGYAFFEETESLPAITVEGGAILPTGDEREGLGNGRAGIEVGIAATKSWIGLYVTVGLGFAYVDSRSREFEYGAGLLYFISDKRDWSASLEFDGSAEEEFDGGAWEHTAHLTPGVSYGWTVEDRYKYQIGIGFPIGLTGLAEESDDFGVMLQLQLEF